MSEHDQKTARDLVADALRGTYPSTDRRPSYRAADAVLATGLVREPARSRSQARRAALQDPADVRRFTALLKRWEGGYEVHLFDATTGEEAGVTQCTRREEAPSMAVDYLALAGGVFADEVVVTVIQTVVNEL